MAKKSSADEANRAAYKSTLSVVLESEKVSEDQEKMLQKLRKKLSISQEDHDELYAEIKNDQIGEAIEEAKESGDKDKLLELMERSFKANPAQEELWKEKGLLLGAAEKYDEAAHAFTQAMMAKAGELDTDVEFPQIELEADLEEKKPEKKKEKKPEPEEKEEEPEPEEKEEEPEPEEKEEKPEPEEKEEPDVEFEMDDDDEEEEGGLLADEPEWESDDDILSDDEEKKEPLHYIECPKCGADVAIFTKDRPITIECETCGAKGRLTKPYEEEEKEEEKDKIPCPKCGEEVTIPSKERPVVIKCDSCGAKGRLTK